MKTRGQLPVGSQLRSRRNGRRLTTCQRLTKSNGRRTTDSAFTLIEIMVVIGIMAIIFAISIPSIYRQLHKDSMRQAVSDVLDACSRARERAILSGTTCNVHINPRERTISVSGSGGSAKPSAGGNSTYSFEGDQMVEHVAGSGELFSAKLSDRISFFFIAVNEDEELQELDEVVFAFLPNGTSDQVDIVLRSDQNEARGISVDVITGIASVQESKNGGRF